MSFCLYNKKNITRRLEDMNFILSWQKQYFTHLPLENKIYIFAPPCNILYFLCFKFKPRIKLNHDVHNYLFYVFFVYFPAVITSRLANAKYYNSKMN